MNPRDREPGQPAGRLRVRLGAVVVLLLAALAVAVLVSALGPQGSSASLTSIRPSAEVSTEAPSAVIYVHLLGAVTRPGLYELREDARAIDAVAAAGGFTADAERTALNLARFLSDGEQIRVPVIGELPVVPVGESGTIGGKVNLNTADATTLETLPRVGPAMSARIIDWRDTNGRFASIEDLRSVTGIGEKTFAALKDLITV